MLAYGAFASLLCSRDATVTVLMPDEFWAVPASVRDAGLSEFILCGFRDAHMLFICDISTVAHGRIELHRWIAAGQFRHCIIELVLEFCRIVARYHSDLLADSFFHLKKHHPSRLAYEVSWCYYYPLPCSDDTVPAFMIIGTVEEIKKHQTSS